MHTLYKTTSDRILGVYFPLAIFVVTLVAELIFGWTCFSACEDGPLEYFQFLICVVAAILGMRLLTLPNNAYPLWARAVFGGAVLACIYIALEEISYGQRIFGWYTPEVWGVVNNQNETNLHNTSSWLDQKPRLILEIGVYAGGITLPLLAYFKPSWVPKKLAPIFPDKRLLFIAVMALFARILREFEDGVVINRTSELQEAYLYGFVMLYFIFMYQRYSVKSVK